MSHILYNNIIILICIVTKKNYLAYFFLTLLVLKCQIERFPVVFLENAVKMFNRIVLTGIYLNIIKTFLIVNITSFMKM